MNFKVRSFSLLTILSISALSTLMTQAFADTNLDILRENWISKGDYRIESSNSSPLSFCKIHEGKRNVYFELVQGDIGTDLEVRSAEGLISVGGNHLGDGIYDRPKMSLTNSIVLFQNIEINSFKGNKDVKYETKVTKKEISQKASRFNLFGKDNFNVKESFKKLKDGKILYKASNGDSCILSSVK
jgi:hypothetical protein